MADLPPFRLLGPVQVWRDGEQLKLGGPLQRALLGCLLLNVGRVVSRERLIETLWGLQPPPRAARSLETKVSRLRTTLREPAAIVARDGGYVLDVPAEDIDAVRFVEALAVAHAALADDPRAARSVLREGLSLWQGSAVGGIPDGALAVERARLDDQRLDAIEARIQAELALGKAASLVGELQGLRSAHPTRERFTEQLMIALYGSGRQAEALEVYRTAYRMLRDDFGLSPGPRLRELEQAILRHDPSLGRIPLRPRRPGPRRRWLALVMAVAGAGLLAILLSATAGSEHVRRPPAPGLVLLDAASGTVRADIPVGDSQGITRFGFGHVWTIGDNGVMSEIDPRSGSLVRSIPIGVQAGGMAVGAGGIWVTDRNGPGVLRIDPVTGDVDRQARLPMRGLASPEPNGGIAIDAGSLWVARGPEAVDRLNPATLTLQRRFELSQHGCAEGAGIQCSVAAAGRHIWIVGGADGWLAEIDAATGRTTVIHGLRPAVCCVAAGLASAWVAEAHDIAQVSISGRVVRRYPVNSAAIGDVSFDGRYVWATADTTGELLRIDSRSGETRSTHLGNLLISTSASNGIATASALPLPTVPTHDLGPRVLRVGLSEDWLNPTDPAVARPAHGSGRWQWQLDSATCAELYIQRTTGTGTSLEPELAAGPPRVSLGGRRWTIPLRSDFRFSPPLSRTVTAQDERATLIRALSTELGPATPATSILRDVVGLGAYRRHITNGVSGIAVRDGALQLTTRRPVSDLPERLSLPYFCVLPAGMPTPPGGYQDPLPTAGPYYLAEHAGGFVAVLRSNPGYPGPRSRHLDSIIFQMNVPNGTGMSEVEHGRLDYYSGSTVATSRRLACRTHTPGLPGPDIARLCLRLHSG